MTDEAAPATLFQALLGPAFDTLPSSVRALHSVRGHGRYAGRASIERGRHPLARLCAAFAGLPPSLQDVPVTVNFETDRQGETWRRDFGGHGMRSRLRACDGGAGERLLGERLGPMQFRFALHADAGAIHWRTVGARLFGLLPLPVAWFADVRCREAEADGRYTFLVEASMPLIGRLIRYEGWLAPA